MMPLGLEKMAAEIFGLLKSAFLDKAGDAQQFGRQAGQIVALRHGHIGRLNPARFLMQIGQHRPAAKQCTVVGNCLLICRQRGTGIAAVAQAMPALLMRAAIGFIERNQLIDQYQRAVEIALVSFGDNARVERIAVVRIKRECRIARSGSVGEPPILHHVARPADQHVNLACGIGRWRHC